MAYSDDIAGAPDITAGGLGAWDNLTATDGAGEPLNVASSGNNVWQKVFLTAAGDYVFKHDTSVDGDTVMTIYQGPAGAAYTDLVSAGSNDDSAGNSKPKITYTSPGGEWIYIESTGYSGDPVSGQTTIVFALAAAPDFTASTHWSTWYGHTVYVSNVGAYVGPWPPAPPIPAAFFTEEVSPTIVAYLVCLPNTGAPSEPADGSYGTAYYLAARFSGVPNDTNHQWDTGLSPGAGAHLFVLTDAAPPVFAGSKIAPPLYVAGATGPPVPNPASGSWSDWQPVRDQPVPTTGTGWAANSQEEHDLIPGDTNTVAALAAEQPDVAGGTGGASVTASPSPGTNVTTVGGSASKLPDPRSSWATRYSNMEISFEPVAATHAWFPDAMGLKVEGLDYTIVPGKLPTDQDEWVAYEGPVVFDHWADLAIKIRVIPTVTVTGSASTPTAPDVTQRIAWDTFRAFASTDWPLYGSGSGLLTRLAPGSTGPQTLTDTVPMTGVPEDFVLLIQPDTGVAPPSQPLSVPGSGSNSYSTVLEAYFGPTSWDANPAHTADLIAVAHYTDARWRYWQLPAVSDEPKWHGAGGRWADAGGVPLEIYTPTATGLQWVQFVDGPA